MRIIELFLGLGLTLLDTSEAFLNFLTREVEIFDSFYSVYELMFGGGLVFALWYILISWTIDLLP